MQILQDVGLYTLIPQLHLFLCFNLVIAACVTVQLVCLTYALYKYLNRVDILIMLC